MLGFRKKKRAPVRTQTPVVGSLAYGERMGFAADEAFKLLRTNLMFSFTDAQPCRVVGVTSALRGEGKSLTALNLAYSLAQTGKRVLLLEADLRLPSLSKILGIQQAPGLSNLLVSYQDTTYDYAQKYPGAVDFDIITAGDIPPNPSELLGSERMAKTVQVLQTAYQYIIVDLPPVTAVADPLIACPLLHGMLVVVRDDYTVHSALNETIRQLQYTNVKLLGFAYNCIAEQNQGRRNKYFNKYKSYAKKNGYGAGKNALYRGKRRG